jgi:ATP-dependent Clp protease ATP-binding subunit ClpX
LVCGRQYDTDRDRGQVIEIDGDPHYVCRQDWPGFDAGVTLQKRVQQAQNLMAAEVRTNKRAEARAALSAFSLNPREIVTKLDEYVIGQERAKRDIAVGLYDHHRIHQDDVVHSEKGSKPDVELEKANMLLIGPSGSGKTLLARTLARSLGVPFATADATSLSPTGYTGNDVESILTGLYIDAGEDLEWAGRGIVFLDEIDKIGRKSMANPSITRDVSGESVQHALLKLIEGTKAQLPMGSSGRKHPDAPPEYIDTNKILFIGGGAFEGFPEIVAKKMHRKTERMMGLRASPHAAMGDPQRDYEVLAEASTDVLIDSLIEFGFVPELAGRLPIIVPLAPLSKAQMRQALTEPKNAIVRQQIELFGRDGITLVFTDEALDAVVEKATKIKTGVRALRSLVKIMTNTARYEVSGDPSVVRVVISPETLADPSKYEVARRTVSAPAVGHGGEQGRGLKEAV